jgi:Domain of unknown function (DUF1942)
VKTTSIKTAVAAATVATAFGLVGAATAAADDDTSVTATTVGQQAQLTNGGVVQGWTITDLKPSSDVIPYVPRGTLWEATATNEAIQGSVQPIVSNLNARAADGVNYRVLFGLATTQGINPAALAQGQKATGKIYFDVTGPTPDTVVYNDGDHDLLVWNPAPPAPPASSGSGTWTPPVTGGYQSTPAEAAPAPATGSSGTPIAEGRPATPAPETGSAGTPITEGTPLTPSPASAPVPEGSAGTPVTGGTPVAPAPAAGTPITPAPAAAPAPAAGSAGTPVIESAPTTTVVPHGAQYLPAS